MQTIPSSLDGLLFLMTPAGACDWAEQEIADVENRMSGTEYVIIDRVADI
jgi:hypothetical protein